MSSPFQKKFSAKDPVKGLTMAQLERKSKEEWQETDVADFVNYWEGSQQQRRITQYDGNGTKCVQKRPGRSYPEQPVGC